jgi:DNA-binding transcriptional regulator WhiA
MRQEICKSRPKQGEGYRAFCYGLLLFGARSEAHGLLFATEHALIAAEYAEAVRHILGRYPVSAAGQPGARKGAHSRIVLSESDAKKLFSYFSHTSGVPNEKIFSGERFPEFLAGAFAACATISEPARSYHLELHPGEEYLGDLLFERLTTAGYPPKATQKRGQTVLYYKESEQIEDLLTMTGAASCALELIEQKIYKDLRNRANRATNCETANIDKLVRASQSQLDDILFLKTSGGLQALPAELIFMARLREENPNASLAELAALSGVSRSGVNHRLQRLSRAAGRLRRERGTADDE